MLSRTAPQAVPVLAPGQTFGSVTDKISELVLVRPYNWRWFLGLGIGFALTMLLLLAVTWLLFRGVGRLGDRRPRDVGLRDRQLRLVDRDRPRGDADLGDPAARSSRTGGRRSTGSPRR